MDGGTASKREKKETAGIKDILNIFMDENVYCNVRATIQTDVLGKIIVSSRKKRESFNRSDPLLLLFLSKIVTAAFWIHERKKNRLRWR